MMAQVPIAYLRRFDDKENTDSLDGRLGRCYELGSTAQMNMALHGWEVTMTHGTIGPQKIPHCWLEFRLEGRLLVWDPVLDEILPWEHARDALRYRRWTRYTARETATLHIETEHFGPWGKDDLRYDIEVARIDALMEELCLPDCAYGRHVDGCGWRTISTPEVMR